MKALVLSQEKELAWKEVDTPLPTEGKVLVQIMSASLNHRELWISKGLYPGMTLPCILGADGTGVVPDSFAFWVCRIQGRWRNIFQCLQNML